MEWLKNVFYKPLYKEVNLVSFINAGTYHYWWYLPELYALTGDKKYLDAAKMVIDWSEHNVRRKNGGYYNDKCNGWLGISAFSAEAIGDALFYHGKCLDSDTFDKWSGIFLRLTDFVYEYFENIKTDTETSIAKKQQDEKRQKDLFLR